MRYFHSIWHYHSRSCSSLLCPLSLLLPQQVQRHLISSLPSWKSCSCLWQMASSLLGEHHSLAEYRKQQWAWQNLPCEPQCNSSSPSLRGLPLQRENGPKIPSLNFYLWVKTVSYFRTLSSLSSAWDKKDKQSISWVRLEKTSSQTWDPEKG